MHCKSIPVAVIDTHSFCISRIVRGVFSLFGNSGKEKANVP